MTKIEIKDWIIESTTLLANRSDFPFIETQAVLGYVTGKTREWLISHPEFQLSETQLAKLTSLRSRLLVGEPLPYLTGKQAFFGLDFAVDRNVLIPRPETELLVEECIQWLEEHPAKRKLVDVGTGSGIIAITLSDHFADLQVTAIDFSSEALAVAKENAVTLRVEKQITFIQTDLLSTSTDQFDLIAANLPYIPSKTLNVLPVLKFEPRLALDGGLDGLDLIRRLIEQSVNHIRPNGMVILEIEASQSEECMRLAQTAYPHAKVTPLVDLAKLSRIVKIQL